MRGTTQQQWRHALPKTAAVVGPRLNLTFRIIAHRSDA
jgi:alkylated DNA repair dioxygenase AlkB